MEFATRSKIKNVQIKYQVFFSEKRPAAHSPSYPLMFYIFYLNEGVISLIFKHLCLLIFWKLMEIF
jgi:hypothetical protein